MGRKNRTHTIALGTRDFVAVDFFNVWRKRKNWTVVVADDSSSVGAGETWIRLDLLHRRRGTQTKE